MILKKTLVERKKDELADKFSYSKFSIKLSIVFFISLVISLVMYYFMKEITFRHEKNKFDNDVIEMTQEITSDLNHYRDLLYGARSFLSMTEDLNKEKFSSYVNGLNFNSFPSLHGLNYVELVEDNNYEKFYESLKGEYAKGTEPTLIKDQIKTSLIYKEFNKKTFKQHYIIKYFEPVEQGVGLIGNDLSEESLLTEGLTDKENISFVNNYFIGRYKNSPDAKVLFFRLGVYENTHHVYKGSVGVGIKLDENLFKKNINNKKYIKFYIREGTENLSGMLYDSRQYRKYFEDYWFPMPDKNQMLFSKDVILNLGEKQVKVYAYTDSYPSNIDDKRLEYIIGLITFIFSFVLIYRWYSLATDKNRVFKIAEQMVEEIRVTAYLDNLTGLPNRQAFLEDLNKCIEKNPHDKLYVMFLDLDGFKKVNDTLGHASGDLVLQNFANRITEFTQDQSMKCYRLGGDEFTIILETSICSSDFNKQHLEVLAKNILTLTKQSFSVSGEDFFLSVSIGVAEYPTDGKTAKELFKNSDVAMYETKRTGKNNFIFYSQNLSDVLEKKNQMENLLLSALDKNEFYLVYQPKMSKINDKFTVSGAEVLLRWKSDKLGEVTPYEFIPIAEEAGLMPLLGKWVFEETVKKLVELNKKTKLNIALSVNLSVHQFSDSNLAIDFMEITKKYNILPDQLIIEITESTMIKDIDSSKGLLKDFRNYGFKISVDDFGTGYSSLSYLRKFPVNEIKIDRSFTKDVLTDNKDKLIISAIIKLAQDLGLNVVVEGVELEEQLNWFMEQGKLQIQGYYFSKPLKEDDFINFLSNN